MEGLTGILVNVGVGVLWPPVLQREPARVGLTVRQPVGPAVGGGCPLLIMLGCWSLRGLVQVFLLWRLSHSIVIQDKKIVHCLQQGHLVLFELM